MSMFSFQAIHNRKQAQVIASYVVYRLCQCSLFKQFTTGGGGSYIWWRLFIDYVNVLFSSNSQRLNVARISQARCLSIMSMFSFQAIHNLHSLQDAEIVLFIDYVNVLFSSNSQPAEPPSYPRVSCLSIMSMFSFQAIHNWLAGVLGSSSVVYRLCQCSLFKQFTTLPFRAYEAI